MDCPRPRSGPRGRMEHPISDAASESARTKGMIRGPMGRGTPGDVPALELHRRNSSRMARSRITMGRRPSAEATEQGQNSLWGPRNDTKPPAAQPVWYSVLAHRGFFPVKELATFRKLNSRLQGHPATAEHLPGVRIASGSLGQGLSVAVGAALAKKLNNDNTLLFIAYMVTESYKKARFGKQPCMQPQKK